MTTKKRKHAQELTAEETRVDYRPDWDGECDNCGQTPIVPVSGMCGPCHWGTHEALNGGWWDAKADDFDDDFVEEHIPAEPGR